MTIQPTNMRLAVLPMYTGLLGTKSRMNTTVVTMAEKPPMAMPPGIL